MTHKIHIIQAIENLIPKRTNENYSINPENTKNWIISFFLFFALGAK